MGWGCLLFGMWSSVSGRERAQLCIYPRFWSVAFPVSGRGLGAAASAGKGMWGGRHTDNLYVVLPDKNQCQSVSRSGEKGWGKPGMRLCQQGRLAGLGRVTVPARRFAAADGGGGGEGERESSPG